MNFMHETHLTVNEVLKFLYNSKKKCFAGTDLKISRSDSSSMYSNRELPWLYTDTYCGNTIERGTEDVYYDMILVWSMQYRGGILKYFWPISEMVSHFLKYALTELPEAFPVRGPQTFSLSQFEFEGKIYKGNFKYENNWDGTIEKFIGREIIVWDGKLAFYHDYMGGFIRNKYFPTKISGSEEFC